ncbi:MAG TPA: hypothetical protein VGZ01_06050 [Trinickia sp.]|jgi:hypothetical protein|nr:hypothetical protein [Trinickia sp.]
MKASKILSIVLAMLALTFSALATSACSSPTDSPASNGNGQTSGGGGGGGY